MENERPTRPPGGQKGYLPVVVKSQVRRVSFKGQFCGEEGGGTMKTFGSKGTKKDRRYMSTMSPAPIVNTQGAGFIFALIEDRRTRGENGFASITLLSPPCLFRPPSTYAEAEAPLSPNCHRWGR